MGLSPHGASRGLKPAARVNLTVWGHAMITSLNDWLAFLKSSNMIVGLPLLIGGAALMLFGWRMWRVSVVVAFGLGGLAIGALAAIANLLGALAGGTAILLAVMIIYQLYTSIAQQHAVDMHPAMKKFMGN